MGHDDAIRRLERTTCCIVGAGPAGTILARLLASHGIHVTLLERHRDFDRDFRGDTLHPGVLEILDQLGLAQRALGIPHSKMETLTFHAPQDRVTVADLRRLRTRFPYVAMLPQSDLLRLIVEDTRRFGGFEFQTGANVTELSWHDGRVCGVRFQDASQQWCELPADLVVATDGRGSRLRQAAQMEAIKSAPEIDVLWFRMPRLPDQRGGAFLNTGGYMIVLERGDQWQVGFVILKDTFREYRRRGIASMRAAVSHLAPHLSASADALSDWKQIRLLTVQADRLRTWYRDGILFLGDAAHVMSPVGGVGINYAIQDAVEAANVLAGPLNNHSVSVRHLQTIQRRRQLPIRMVQQLQSFDQKYLIQNALTSRASNYRIPFWFRTLFSIPILRQFPSRVFAFGVRRVSPQLPPNNVVSEKQQLNSPEC